MKKWLLTGTLISTLGAFSACSEDSSSDPVGPVDSSGSLVPDSSGDVPGSSDGQPTAKSSSSIADNAEPQMACSEIMYNAPDTSPLEWVEIYIASGMDMDNMQNFLLHLSGAVDYTFPGEPLKKGLLHS